MNVFYKITCVLECSVTLTEGSFNQLVKRFYMSGELRACAVAVFNVACLLPYRAIHKLTFFLDAIAAQLRTKVNYDEQSLDSYQKLSLVQLGLGQLSKKGRLLW